VVECTPLSAPVGAAYGAFFRAVEEIQKTGTFNFSAQAKPYAELNRLFDSFEH
jgi:hypothetical protein